MYWIPSDERGCAEFEVLFVVFMDSVSFFELKFCLHIYNYNWEITLMSKTDKQCLYLCLLGKYLIWVKHFK